MTPIQPLEAQCSLYCGVCRLYQATQAGEVKTLERLARVYSRLSPQFNQLQGQDLLCDGCLSQRRAAPCAECTIRECASQRKLHGCHNCPDFPCDLIDRFPVETGRRVMLRAVPFRRQHGTAVWIAQEIERYSCPVCRRKLYRGVNICPGCRQEIDLD